MSIPYYVNENKSDMLGIKPGWYAMDDSGKLSSGPYQHPWSYAAAEEKHPTSIGVQVARRRTQPGIS